MWLFSNQLHVWLPFRYPFSSMRISSWSISSSKWISASKLRIPSIQQPAICLPAKIKRLFSKININCIIAISMSNHILGSVSISISNPQFCSLSYQKLSHMRIFAIYTSKMKWRKIVRIAFVNICSILN